MGSGLERRSRAEHATEWLAAMLALMSVGGELEADPTIDTGPGERHKIALADGTVVHAGSSARLSVEYSSNVRFIRLERGEVLFEVAKERERPFVVETQRSTIRALGTVFVVNRVDPDGDLVTVKEGAVAVSRRTTGRTAHDDAGAPATVKAGEQVRVSKAAAALSVEPGQVQKAVASVEGWLEFDRETVAQAVRQFNLRNRTKIRLANEEIGERPVRGAFEAEQPRKFVAFLERQRLVSVIDEDDDVLLLVPYAPKRR